MPALTFDAIGTGWTITTGSALSGPVRAAIDERIQLFDATYSRFRPDSLVTKIATAGGGSTFSFPPDCLALFSLYDDLYAATGGAVDPLVGRGLELLGYDATYTLVPHAAGPMPHRARWPVDVLREGVTVTTRQPVVIDVGAAGKGYLVDLITAILHDAAITEHVIDAGGDLRHHGDQPVRVGLEHPFQPGQVIGVASLHNGALCASAVNRRAWGDGLHHIIDARTGVPTRDVAATWVVADNAALADGLATALFFTDARGLSQRFRFTYVRMLSDGRAEISPDFPGQLFT
ncbi:FAD:protein FMN transferase [Actinoplanes sp. CA-142083]|uniref:FAD:protein FMN transferase n=1 Tax=Actinoplanes sp. CA-142083 TaxID=3239903 RepID=UPI003D8C9C10